MIQNIHILAHINAAKVLARMIHEIHISTGRWITAKQAADLHEAAMVERAARPMARPIVKVV